MNDLNDLNNLNNLKRQAYRNIGTDKVQIGVAVFYTAVCTGQALTQPAVVALTWTLFYSAIYGGVTWFSYRSELNSLREAAEFRALSSPVGLLDQVSR